MTRGPLLHADADAFFVSVALRNRPDLVGLPVAVVAHVFVASASYQARARGVRGAMLVQEARRLCPELIVLDVPFADVEEVGEALFDVFHEFTDAVEPGSIEEAFLDVDAQDVQAAVRVGKALRHKAATDLRIPVTVGIGRTKLMAKLASRAGKPNGLYVIDADEERRLRHALTPNQVWGIGATTLKKLSDLGVSQLADLDRFSDVELRQSCGSTMARRLRGYRDGTDDATVRTLQSRTSFSSEGTTTGYARPDASPLALLQTCLARVCHRAQRSGLVGTKLTMTLRPEAERRPILLHVTVPDATAEPDAWLPPAREMLERQTFPRLTGLGVTLAGLVPTDQVQATLF